MSYIDELEARFPTKGVTFICEVQAMRHGEACATVDRLRVSIAASRARCEALEADNRALRANLQRIELMIPTDRNERTGERGIFHDEQPDSPGGFLPCDCDELAEEILNYVRTALRDGRK